MKSSTTLEINTPRSAGMSRIINNINIINVGFYAFNGQKAIPTLFRLSYIGQFITKMVHYKRDISHDLLLPWGYYIV